MSEARQPSSELSRHPRRVNPLAVVGVLFLVIVSIMMGILGPQISQRGNLAVGVPLIDLLTQVHVLFVREQRAVQVSRGIAPHVVRQSTIEDALSKQLGVNEVPLDLTGIGFKAIGLDEAVRLEDISTTGVAVVYEQVAESLDSVDSPEIVLLLYLPFSGEARSLYARNGFGVPASIESGALYIRQIPGMNGTDLWSATWRVRSVIYVLIVPGERLFDALIDTLQLSRPKDGGGMRIASAFFMLGPDVS